MINNYRDFLVEKIIYNSVNESVIHFSKKFKKMIGMIDSPISIDILAAQGEDMPVKSNYFDVDTRDTIAFIPDDKAQKFNKSDTKDFYFLRGNTADLKYHSIYLEGEDDEIKQALSKYGDYNEIVQKPHEQIGEDETGEIIYTQKDEERLCIVKFGDKFAITNKSSLVKKDSAWVLTPQKIRVGRGIKALLPAITSQKYTDAEIEDFVNKWKAAWDWIHNEFRSFEIVSGEDIGFYYSYLNYEQVTGTLGNSCMREKPSRFFEIYAKNPEVCKLVILKSEKKPNKITGRALLWTLESGELFLDRIYTQEDSHLALFRKYASKNGWIHKKRNGASITSELVMPDGSLVQKKISVRLKKIQYNTFPYLDTLTYLAYTKDAIILTNDVKSGDWVLSSVDGEKRPIICSYCSNTGRLQCETCYGEGNILKDCDKCKGNGGVTCKSCEGTGSVSGENCGRCEQYGVIECDICLGSGESYVECESCGGEGTYQCEFC